MRSEADAEDCTEDVFVEDLSRPMFMKGEKTPLSKIKYHLPDLDVDFFVEHFVPMVKKKWQPKYGDRVYYPTIHPTNITFPNFWVLNTVYSQECSINKDLLFQSEEEAEVFCKRLNDAIKPILDERKEGEK